MGNGPCASTFTFTSTLTFAYDHSPERIMLYWKQTMKLECPLVAAVVVNIHSC